MTLAKEIEQFCASIKTTNHLASKAMKLVKQIDIAESKGKPTKALEKQFNSILKRI